MFANGRQYEKCRIKRTKLSIETNIIMKTKTSILALTKAFFILLVMFSAFSCGDFGKCKEQDPSFRPHKVRHCNKSKIYWYYHNTPCDCNDIRNDLELDSHFGKEYRNYVEYYDNGEIVWGR